MYFSGFYFIYFMIDLTWRLHSFANVTGSVNNTKYPSAELAFYSDGSSTPLVTAIISLPGEATMQIYHYSPPFPEYPLQILLFIFSPFTFRKALSPPFFFLLSFSIVFFSYFLILFF